MTFEDTKNSASAAAEETKSRMHRPRAAPADRPLASRMLDFVKDASAAGGRLEGLALLFRSTFLPSDGGGASADLADAAEIVADCMEAISKSLILIGTEAHEVHNHALRGGAR